MEQTSQKPRRNFTPQQKYEIIKDIERCATIREGLEKDGIRSSVYYKWKRQLSVAINASLRIMKPVKFPEPQKARGGETGQAQEGHTPGVLNDHEPKKR